MHAIHHLNHLIGIPNLIVSIRIFLLYYILSIELHCRYVIPSLSISPLWNSEYSECVCVCVIFRIAHVLHRITSTVNRNLSLLTPCRHWKRYLILLKVHHYIQAHAYIHIRERKRKLTSFKKQTRKKNFVMKKIKRKRSMHAALIIFMIRSKQAWHRWLPLPPSTSLIRLPNPYVRVSPYSYRHIYTPSSCLDHYLYIQRAYICTDVNN